MQAQDFFNRVIKYYQGSFDFTIPFTKDDIEYTALAEFHSHVDKYVLVKKAQVWAADSHEFCIFQTYEDLFTTKHFEELTRLLTDYMEPELVRKGNDTVEKNHMYTYLSLVIFCNKGADKEVIKAAKHYHFTKYYNMYTRGYSEAHIILVDIPGEKVYTNGAGREMKKLYKRIFKELRKL